MMICKLCKKESAVFKTILKTSVVFALRYFSSYILKSQTVLLKMQASKMFKTCEITQSYSNYSIKLPSKKF